MLSETQLTKIRSEIAKVREGEAKLVAIALDVIAERDAAQARLVPFPATETCQECGSALGIGFHIADDVWAKISPTGGEGGVLCPWCADKRLKALGLTDVPAVFFPAFDVLRDEPGEWERRAREAEERARELEGHLTLDSGSLAEYEESVVPALEARIKAPEADAALGALVRRVVETHKTVEIVRSSTGYHDVLLNGHIDVHGKRHAIHGGGRKLDDALRAALGEGREEGE
jgi:hypothetical protein